jgi:hypothetical protein
MLFLLAHMCQQINATALNHALSVSCMYMLLFSSCATCVEGVQLPQQQCERGSVTGPVWLE